MKKRQIHMLMMITVLAMVALAACDQGGPTINAIQGPNRLGVMLTSDITVTCDVTAAQWNKITTVTVDLSAIGGESSETLEETDNGTWFFSGPVTPPEAGEKLITITAVDTHGRTDAMDWTVQVLNPADHPPGNEGQRFTDNWDGTVSDNHTNLMWQQDTCEKYSTWQQAMDYCDKLKLANHTDWRLPSKDELLELCDGWQSGDKYTPAAWLDAQGFYDTQAGAYWSSTEYTEDMAQAWYVNFGIGSAWGFSDKDLGSYVRAVRGGQ